MIGSYPAWQTPAQHLPVPAGSRGQASRPVGGKARYSRAWTASSGVTVGKMHPHLPGKSFFSAVQLLLSTNADLVLCVVGRLHC